MERKLHLMKITAKTDEALDVLIEKYSNFNVDATQKESFKDIAYTCNTGRADFSQRAVVIAKTTNDALNAIKSGKFIRGEENLESIGKICFLFTGQGSQYPGMAKNLYETSPVFRIHFEYCEKILKDSYGIDIKQILWSANNSSQVSRTLYSQTSIFCVEHALLKLWESWGVKPDYVIGHSLGEFAGKMLVIKGDQKCVDTLLNCFPAMDKNKVLDYAAINSNDQTVVAGDSEYILKFSEHCKTSNVKCTVLESSHAFHSKHMDPMLESYRSVAETLKQMKGNKNCKYISGMRGSCLEEGILDAEYWVEHTREKVSFLDASKIAAKLGCKTFIEIGPQPVLSALTMMINDDVQLTCLPSLRRNVNEWETLLNTVGKLYVKGLEIDWKGFEAFYERKVVPNLPNYPFIRKTFWPDLLSVSGQVIHPLIGSVIPNASSAKLFQCGMNLRNIEYVKDHVVGNNIIFPGTGYLEMCLAAGIATTEGCTESLPRPTRPMKVENLFIEAPLLLNESKTCHLQTVTELNLSSNVKSDEKNWNGINIKICRQLESDSSKWFPHARATFSPLVSSHDKQVEFDVINFQENLHNLSPNFSTQVYSRLASVGLKFGPTFRSIEATWRNEDKQLLIAKVKIPAQDQSEKPGNYVIHPVILDAMIQSIMMLSFSDKGNKTLLHLPIKIGKFIWLSDPNLESSQLYIQSFNTNSKQQISSATSILIDAGGKVLGIMSNVELIQTTLNTFESVLQQQTNILPEFLEEVWQKTKSPSQYATDMEKTSHSNLLTEEYCRAFNDEFNDSSQYIKNTFKGLERLVYLNVLQTLIKLGWKPELNKTFCEENLFCSLGFKTEFRKYFAFMLQLLEGEGILQKIDQKPGENWRVVKNPPSNKDIQTQLTSQELTSELIHKFKPTLLFQKLGESLENIFKGSVSATTLLFPESGSSFPSVADFYHEYRNFFQITQLIDTENLLLKSISELQTKPEFELRILEVGAGTGAQTETLLEFLETNAIPFEYTYTDISSSFFVQAQETFKKNLSSIKFRKLDIEKDPLDQGFTPEYYDFIVAAEVIHATKYMSESLRNVRMLLKPFGRLCIVESTKINSIVTFLFGPLEGYWRFQDFELRPNHCVIEKEKWAQVLQSNGFRVDGMISVFNDKHSCIVSHKTQQQLSYSTQACKKTWLIFLLQNHPISDQILKKFEHLEGRRVIRVTAGERFENEVESTNSFVLRKTEYEDFAAMLELVFNQQNDVEGIIYCWALNKNVSTQEELLQPYFNLTKALLILDLKRLPRLALITSGVVPLEDNDLSSFHSSTLLAYSKSMKSENIHFNCKSIEIADGREDESRVQEIFYEIWSSAKENQIAFSRNSRYVPKLTPHKPLNSALQLPNGTDRFHLIMPETKSIPDLQFGPMDLFEVKENEVEVQVKASALNFKDVLSVLKPSPEFDNINAIGFDFSGVVTRVGGEVTKWQVGDRVSGCNMLNQALPSHVIIQQDLLIPVPNHQTFCEAATIPAVYVTSIVCLIETAKIRKDDIVLSHTATGGVGLSAIEICKHIGCTIIATAVGKRKQNYLRSLGIKHIFHSRDTRYADLILDLTNGHGVDVVLNSLTSEGFKEATLRACATGARFVEMSKLNIWKPEEVKELLPDVNYTIVDVSSSDLSEWNHFLWVLRDLMDKRVVKPIPYVRFDGQNIREALQFMQKAKHVGKIVCVIPEVRNDGGEIKIHTPIFSDNATYLITGGLGGIGFAVCKWMVENGAKHVILASRGPPSDPISKVIHEMNKTGAKIIPAQLDVGNFKQCEDFLHNQLPNLNIPSLKGIMHAAGTLADGLIINQTWDTLSSTFKSKINGTLNLHELTKHLNLEDFVLFSSVVATFGLPGQSNHAAANAFEDAFAHYRQSIGLPATTIIGDNGEKSELLRSLRCPE